MTEMNPRTKKVYDSQRNKMMNACDCGEMETCFTKQHIDKIDTFLDGIENINTRKNYLANIVSYITHMSEDQKVEVKEQYSLSDMLAKYRAKMMELCAICNNVAKSQQKTPKQEDDWMSLNELQKLRKEMLQKIKDKSNPTWKDIQPFFVSSLYLADESNPPIRNEYGDMTVVYEKDGIHSTDKTRNYLVITGRNKKYFMLNDYKTVKTHGAKLFKVGPKLNKIINQFIKFHPIDTDTKPESPLLFNTQGGALSRNGLTKYLQNKVFTKNDKKISSTMLRHIYISEKIEGPLLKVKEDLADKMCHSTNLQELYKKENV